MAESENEMLARVAAMADGDPKWDLSDNDQAALRYMLSEMARQATDVCKLRLALKPFADFAPLNAGVPDNLVVSQGSPMAARQLTIGDLRQAAAVIGR